MWNGNLQPRILCKQSNLQVGPALLMFYVTKNYMLLDGRFKLNEKINNPKEPACKNFTERNTIQVANQVFEH